MKNDHELIRKFQAGRQSAFDDLVKRHLQTVVGFFVSVTKDPVEAEDLAQEVFLKLYKGLPRFRFEADFRTYLYRIQLNTANSYLRWNRWRNFLHLDQAPTPEHYDTELEMEWSRKDLWDAIAKLPRKQKMVVMMRISQELPYKEIATILNMSEGSAKVNYHHGITKLKEILGEH